MDLEKHIVHSVDGKISRDVWISPGPREQGHTLAVFMDGEHYLRDMNATDLLAPAQASGKRPPMTCVFISHVSREARHTDSTCNDPYSRFITKDVVSWAKQANSGNRETGHLVAGLSLSGLTAAFAAQRRPDVFSFALCQSGSFWWNGEWLTHTAKSWGPTRLKAWLSVGDEETNTGVSHPPTGLRQEITQICGVQNAAQELRGLGGEVKFNVFPGGHAIVGWRRELLPALC